MPSRRLRPHDHRLRKRQRACSVVKGTSEFCTRQARNLLLSVASFYGISRQIRNVGQSSLTLPPYSSPLRDHFARQLCDFSALKQQQHSSKQKYESSSSIPQASSRTAASPVPGSTSPTRLRPRSQHGSGNTSTAPAAAGGGGKVSSNGVRGTSPSAFSTSADARNSESTSPLRLSSPNSPPLTHKNYKVSLRASHGFSKANFPWIPLQFILLATLSGSCWSSCRRRCWDHVAGEHFARRGNGAVRLRGGCQGAQQRDIQGQCRRWNWKFPGRLVAS
jgi:hypothetical protein